MEVATLRAGAEGSVCLKFKPDFSETPGGYSELEMAASKNCTQKYMRDFPKTRDPMPPQVHSKISKNPRSVCLQKYITKFPKTQIPSTLPGLYHLYSPAD